MRVPGNTLALVLAIACGACAPFEIVTMEGNYITYRHAFTEAGAAGARKSAERLCGQTKQVPVQIRSACTLNNCTTHYQCMNKAEAEHYR